MKHLTPISILALMVAAPFATAATLSADAPLIYVNENFGFNVKGYKYQQSEIPCKIDKNLVASLIEKGAEENIRIEAVKTAEKIRSKKASVLLIDIDGLILGGSKHSYGMKKSNDLPSIKVTAALVDNAKNTHTLESHQCSIMALHEFSPSSSILDMGNTATVCSATRKCIKDLSKDLIKWLKPQLKP